MLELLLNCSWRFEQCQYMCLVFCFSLWMCPYPPGSGFSFSGSACLVHLTAGVWIPLVCGPCSTAVSLFQGVTQAVAAVSSSTAVSHWAHWLLAAVQPECSPGFGNSFQLWCSSCTHQKAGDGAPGWGLDFSLLIVSKFSVDDKTSSLRDPVTFASVYLFTYLTRFFFWVVISRGSSTFFHFSDSPVLV